MPPGTILLQLTISCLEFMGFACLRQLCHRQPPSV